ncbi:MAG: hypothetical protein WCW01_04465 [Gammaproteobacteria bacterium]
MQNPVEPGTSSRSSFWSRITDPKAIDTSLDYSIESDDSLPSCSNFFKQVVAPVALVGGIAAAGYFMLKNKLGG